MTKKDYKLIKLKMLLSSREAIAPFLLPVKRDSVCILYKTTNYCIDTTFVFDDTREGEKSVFFFFTYRVHFERTIRYRHIAHKHNSILHCIFSTYYISHNINNGLCRVINILFYGSWIVQSLNKKKRMNIKCHKRRQNT